MAATNAPRSLRSNLALAACALLGTTLVHAAEVKVSEAPAQTVPAVEDTTDDYKPTTSPWSYTLGLLGYKEDKGRVQAIEPALEATKALENDRIFKGKIVIDSLTGASHNGASPSTQAQTFTRPSGKESYSAGARELPLDDTFHDTRVAVSASLTQPLDRLSTYSYGGNVSKEYDYLALSVNGGYTRDFNEKNTTFMTSLSYAHDTISPEGKIPIPFATMVGPGPNQPRGSSSETKDTLDYLVGVTQVLDRSSLVQFNYSLSYSQGYLTDPFKLLSIIDGNGDTTSYVYESRPDQRTKHGLFGLWKKHLKRDIVDASYRFMTDDWGINSHTLDFHYRWFLTSSQKHFLEPHLRLYSQNEADFYRNSLRQGALPRHATGDQRLGEMTATTLGLKYGYRRENEKEVSIRVEHYMQKNETDSGIGSQRSVDLAPDLKAMIVQVLYEI